MSQCSCVVAAGDTCMWLYRKLWLLKAVLSGDVVHRCSCVVAAAGDTCTWLYRKLWLLKAVSGDVVHGWPVNIARQLNTAPLVTRLYPLDLTLLVRTTHTHVQRASFKLTVLSLENMTCDKRCEDLARACLLYTSPSPRDS